MRLIDTYQQHVGDLLYKVRTTQRETIEKAAEIIDGLHLMMLALDVKQAIIGVEMNKQDAIQALNAACEGVDGIRIMPLPVRYPQGGEKQLVYAVSRRKVPAGGLPLDVGCVVCNVGTVYAVQQARSASMASGLFFSTPMTARLMSRASMISLTPSTIWADFSSIRR